MSNLTRNFTHVTIPAEIWLRKDISMQAKCLWAELRSLHDSQRGGCFASDEYLMEFIGLKRSRLHEIFKELKDVGLLETVSFNGRTTVRRAIVPEVEYVTGQQLSGKPDTSNPENRTPGFRKTGFTPYIENKEENKDKNIAQTAAPLRKKTSEISLSLNERKFTNITDQDLKDWKEIYPLVDIKAQLTEMIQWLLSNPTRSSRTLWRKFITNWLKKEQVKLYNQEAYRQAKTSNAKKDILEKHTGFQKDERPRDPSKTIKVGYGNPLRKATE